MTDERENDENASMWTPEARLEYEEWLREQDAIPPHEATYDDYLEAMK